MNPPIEIAKIKLYHLLLCKGFKKLTPNEVKICENLEKDDDIQQVLKKSVKFKV